MSDRQLQAERGHILKELLLELGGLAHEHMDTPELDRVLDNMLTKVTPNNPSVDLQRWVHTHRNNKDFKIHQILGAHVAKISALVPECFGKFHDKDAAECKMCLDRTLCATRTASNKDSEAPAGDGLVQIKQAYPMKVVSTDALSGLLSRKNGQIAQHLHHGSKVVLLVVNNKLSVRTIAPDTAKDEQGDSVMGTKGKPAPAEEVEEELEAEEVEGEEGTEEEVEEGAEEAEEAAEEEAEPVAEEKPKKAKKPKPVLNKAQQEFQDKLDALGDTAAKQKYSQETIKKLGIKHDNNADPRVAHMQRVMAIKKHLGAQAKPAAKPAAAKK